MGVNDGWSKATNVLCVRLDSMGDVLMTTPAMRALKGPPANRRITLLTSAAGAAVARMIPEIDEILVYEAPWMKATPLRTDAGADHEMAEMVRGLHFDAAAIFTVYTQNPLPAALLCYLAGIPLRLAHCRENPYQLLTHWVPDPEPQDRVRHEVRRQLDLVRSVGFASRDERLSLEVPREARDQVIGLLDEADLDPAGNWAVIHPGASAPSRRYPPEGFSAAAASMVRGGCQVLFTGTGDERKSIELIRKEMKAPSHSLVGRLTLEQLAALISLAPVLVANNTGPVHIAAAVGTPVVVLYALTNPQHTPWGVPSRVLYQDVPCRNCYGSICREGHHNCLRQVPPDAVSSAVFELLGERKEGWALQDSNLRRMD